MLPTLLRGLRTLLGLALLLAAGYPALATHLLGGEMTYRYLDANGPAAAPLRYEITITIYNNCPYDLNNGGNGLPTAPNSNAVVGIFDQATGARIPLTAVNYPTIDATSGGINITQSTIVPTPTTSTSSSNCLGPRLPGGCAVNTPVQRFALQRFTAIVNLPVNLSGFYAVFSRAARNDGITNLQNSGGAALQLYATLTPPLRPNRSPIFSDTAVALICQGDTTVLLNNAVDPDGDRLVYSFGTPYGGTLLNTFTPPPPSVTYAAGYSATTPLGTTGGAFASINAATGVAKYRASSTAASGKYVVAVDVSEYRTINNSDGTTSSLFIGTTRRDLQLVVASCPATISPALATPALQPRSYTIEAGATLTFPITATQSGGNPLLMTVNSALLDGAGGITSTFNGSAGTVATGGLTGTATATGTGTVTGTFSYTPSCDAARTAPYDVAVTVQDRACGGKTVADVYRITVVRPTGPTGITGDDVICGVPATRSYTATGGTAPNFIWTVTGGTIVGSNTANPVTVNWTTTTGGTLSVQGVSQYNCRTTETASKSVSVVPGPTLTVTGNLTICSGTTTTINVSGSGSTYTVTGGPVTGSGSTFVLAPTTTTTYTVTSSTVVNGCNSSAQVTVTVNPTPAANVGATPRSTCSGVPITLGAAPVTGNTYQWTPATGLSSATVANPTLTLTNTTGSPITQTYTLVERVGTCSATNSVTVTVNPAVTAAPGSPVTFCSGGSAQLGAAPVAGFTYQWSPATGLSDATVANPTVTLTNTTGTATTTTYTLTTTNTATTCSGTATVVVTVNPAVTATPGSPVTFCSGGSAQLGAAPVAGFTYQWTPATGLSDATVANPTVTLTNTTGAATTTTYTLTTTNPTTTCSGTATVTVTVNPAVVANPGNAVTTCSGVPVTIGAAPVAGFTYQWTPATGLSDATVANPTVTLTNTTGAATTTTYTLTTTNTATTCSGTATVVVTVNPAVVANAGAAVTFCSGGSAQLGAAPVAGLTYQWSPATGLSSATVANPTVTLTNTTGAATTQTYTLTTTNPTTTCSGTATVTVTVNPAVTANAGSAVSICSGASAQIGAAPVAGFTYLWTPATGLSSATVANPTVTLTNTTNAPTTQTYTLTTTNTATGCLGTGTVVVTVNPAVVVNAGAAATFCSGGSAQLGGAPVAGYTYSWSPTTGLSSATVANPTVTLTNTTGAATTTTYTVTVTDGATQCVNTGTVTVTVNPAVTANAGSAVSICSGASATLGAAPVTGFTYLWTPATGLSSATVANPTVTLTNATAAPITQTYTLTTTNATTTCFGTATVVVTVNPAVTANAGPAQAVCDNSTITLGTPALPGHTYQWSPTTNLSSATVAQPVLTGVNTTNAPITQTYTLTATTAGNCTATSTVVVTINPRPATPVIAGAASVCPTITGVAYNVVTPATGATYTWTVTGGTIAGGQGTAAITVDWGLAGTGSVRVFATNTQGCNSPAASLPVIINLVLQTPTPTGPTTVCQADGSVTYSTPAVNGSSYGWQLTGTAVGTLVNTGNSTTITFTQPGTAQLVVTEVSNPSGGICRGTSNPLTITVNPSPATTLAITGPDRFCFNSGAQTYTLAGAAGSTYVFTLNGAPLANANGVATVPATTVAGTYTLTARETNSFGCVGQLYTRTFIVDPRPGAITISGPRFVCPATRTLTYSVPNATAASTYQWTVTNGTIASGQGTPTITVTFAAGLTANATVSVTESSQFSCGGPAVAVTVVPDNSQAPQLTLASVVPTDNGRVTLTFSVATTANTPNQVQVRRRVAGTMAYTTIGTVAPTATTYTDASAGLNAAQNAYEYSLELTNGCGDVLTAATAHTTVKLAAVTVPGAPGTPRDQGGTNLSWTAYQGFAVANYQVYQQNDNGGYVLLTTVSGSTLAYSVPNRGQGFNQCYRVVAVAADGRASNANTICVEFTNGLAFYNIITPNNDGLNDKLEILNVQLYPGNTMEIYNRWGRQVYKTSNYNNDTNFWGTDPNIAPGVYYFLFKQASGNATKGWVEVVK